LARGRSENGCPADRGKIHVALTASQLLATGRCEPGLRGEATSGTVRSQIVPPPAQPRSWRLNLPGRDFRFEIEDLGPALAGTIGKVVLTTAIVATFAIGFGLSPQFVAENVRYEMLIAALLFVIPVSGFFNPRANLPGCHGPMIPLIGLIVAAGGHPLALGILVAVFGLTVALFKGASRLISLTGTRVSQPRLTASNLPQCGVARVCRLAGVFKPKPLPPALLCYIVHLVSDRFICFSLAPWLRRGPGPLITERALTPHRH